MLRDPGPARGARRGVDSSVSRNCLLQSEGTQDAELRHSLSARDLYFHQITIPQAIGVA